MKQLFTLMALLLTSVTFAGNPAATQPPTSMVVSQAQACVGDDVTVTIVAPDTVGTNTLQFVPWQVSYNGSILSNSELSDYITLDASTGATLEDWTMSTSLSFEVLQAGCYEVSLEYDALEIATNNPNFPFLAQIVTPTDFVVSGVPSAPVVSGYHAVLCAGDVFIASMSTNSAGPAATTLSYSLIDPWGATLENDNVTASGLGCNGPSLSLYLSPIQLETLGSYILAVDATNACGPSPLAIQPVEVVAAPTFTLSTDPVCDGENALVVSDVEPTEYSNDVAGTPTVQWSWSNGNSSLGLTTLVNPADGDLVEQTVDLVYTVTDGNGTSTATCSASASVTQVVHTPTPLELSFNGAPSASTLCAGDILYVAVVSETALNETANYSWFTSVPPNGGDATSRIWQALNQSLDITVGQNSVFDDGTTCDNSDSPVAVTIPVNAIPSISWANGDDLDAACAGSVAALDVNLVASSGAATTVSWTSPLGGDDQELDGSGDVTLELDLPAEQPAGAIAMTVTAVDNAGCVSNELEGFVDVRVAESPAGEFETACEGQEIQPTNVPEGGNLSYSWTYNGLPFSGEGDSTSTPTFPAVNCLDTPDIELALTTSYDVAGESLMCTSEPLAFPVTVTPVAQFALSLPDVLCADSEVELEVSGPGLTAFLCEDATLDYAWAVDRGNGFESAGEGTSLDLNTGDAGPIVVSVEAITTGSAGTCVDVEYVELLVSICNGSDVYGCANPIACNFNEFVTVDDGSCEFLSCLVLGCPLVGACNYNPEANINDGSCEYVSCQGCMNPDACNYDETATVAGICDFVGCAGCSDPLASNYMGDGPCTYCESINELNSSPEEECFIGSGNIPKDHMNVGIDACNGITASLGVHQRYAGSNYEPFEGNLTRYEVPVGYADVPLGAPEGSKWNYLLSVNLGEYVFADVNVKFGLDFDPADNFSASDLEGSYTIFGEFSEAFPLVETGTGLDYGQETIFQDTQNLGFDFWSTLAQGVGANVDFDPNAVGVYNFGVYVYSLEGALLTSSEISVQALLTEGCTDPEACNYNPEVTEDDGSCLEEDECGICGGGGIPQGDCDCEGNQLDIVGICGGDCTSDENSNGVCDDQESLDPDEYRLEVDTVVVHESGDLAGYTTYRLYVECLHPLDFVVSCSGDESNPLLLASTSSEGWYNSPLASGWSAVAINELFFTAFPEMEFDSFLTIGADNSSYPSSMHPISLWGAIDVGLEFDQDGPGTNVLVNDEVGGSWFQTVPLTLDDSLTHPAFAGPAQRVLLAQITTPGRLYGQIQLQIFGEGLDVNEFRSVLQIPFEGCLNPEACNFSPYATMDDGSCAESDPCGVCGGSGFVGCTDTEACNYTAEACGDDGSCEFTSCVGCTDSSACNYEYAATVDSGTCIYPDCAGNCFNDPCACCCPGDCNYPDCLAWENDGDGICDQICCECVGVDDECGVCNGPGAILECGCSSVPEGACDCQGNQLDAVGICGGNCLLDNDNNGICDDEEIYGCTYPLATNFDALASRDDGSCVFPCVGDINQNIFDWDANGNIGIADFLMMLSVFGDVDVDGDGVWDSQDDCVDLEACNFANDPTEACQFLDILGVCGGGCDVDSDGDGICDDTDTCVGVLDECGVCNGPGPTNIIVEAITVFYDSLYLPLDEEWFVYAVDADTTFAFECPPTTDGCSDPSEEIPPYSLVVEASEPVNPANGTVYRFYVTAAYSTDRFSAVFGNDNGTLLFSTPDGIYNSELNSSWNASGVNPTIVNLFPEVQDDSFATIGLDLGYDIPGAEHPLLVQDDIFSPTVSDYFTQGGTQLLAEGVPGSAWFVVSSQDAPLPNSLPMNDRWFIAQITTTGDISGQINFQVISEPSVGEPFPGQIQRSIEFAGCGTFN